ncbi:MAG: hypothetical protein HPY66_1395 [Firmicutes bacterium]|nr:hypothetical protein [Bacillota bacterium]MDI6706706.1 hypothetical protein [Bacillota bacterium]
MRRLGFLLVLGLFMVFLLAGCNANPSQQEPVNNDKNQNNAVNNVLPESTMDRQQLLADLTGDGKEEIILGPPSSLPPEVLNEKLGGPLTVYSADGQVLLDKEKGAISVVGTYHVGAEHPVLIVVLWGGGSMGMYYGAYLYDADKGQLKQLEWDNYEFAVGELVDDKPGSLVIWNRGLNPEGGYKPFYQRWIYKNGQITSVEKWAAQ